MEEQFAVDTVIEPAEVLKSNAAMFGLLSQLFLREPTENFIESLRETRFPAHTGNDDMDKGIWMLASYLSRTGDSAAEELGADYFRTFIGGGTDSFSAAYPMESVHTGRKRLRMGAARDEVLAIYRAYGMEKGEGMRDEEDHIACELGFLRVLSERAVTALEQGDEAEAEALVKAQANFMDDHLLNWVPKFTQVMRMFAKTDFYLGLSWLTLGFIQDSRVALEELLG